MTYLRPDVRRRIDKALAVGNEREHPKWETAGYALITDELSKTNELLRVLIDALTYEDEAAE